MPFSRSRRLSFLLAPTLLIPLSSSGYDGELSDTAVRNAYFLGQHRDEQTGQIVEMCSRCPKSPIVNARPWLHSA